MKNYNFILLAFISLLFSSCEIVQETTFNENGSGNYSLGFDFSEMMKMRSTTQGSNNKQVDTIINFSNFLELKKDSISKLSLEKQQKLKQLEDFSMYIHVDSISKSFKMKINYDFKSVEDLARFGEKLKDQDIKELELLSSKVKKTKDKDDKGIPDFNDSYTTTFNRDSFSLKITQKALNKANKEKDTTLKKDNPMVDMIRFKTRYFFPYKIKSINNTNARVLPDFKGVEISANLYEISNNPKFFDMNIEFEK